VQLTKVKQTLRHNLKTQNGIWVSQNKYESSNTVLESSQLQVYKLKAILISYVQMDKSLKAFLKYMDVENFNF
jgi:hypothetical protein